MKCPECQTELPDTAKFCNECGRKIEIVCPQCGNLNPSGSKFCLECGHGLRTPASSGVPTDLSFDEKLSKIQRYLPKGLTEKILAQRDKIEGERRNVTVMFCDMVGFTPLVEKLGPEDAYALMDQVQEILIHKVHEYEGTVNQLTGDGLMALFGAPIALEDAPQRAIRSSLAIHREMTRFSEKIREESGFPTVKMRIGINTGPVVVGTVGNDLRVEFAAVGDTVNTASRMEGLAEPGTTCVTEETFKLTEGFFRFEGLGYKEIKGKQEPMKVFRVIAPSTRRTRFDVSTERGLTRFVGRERELEIMLDAFERAKGGRGQAVSLVGEAGVGKSRLLYEFRKTVANEDVNFLEGKGLSYGKGVPYHPFLEILMANFDVQEGDRDSEIKDKVKRSLELLGADESSILPYLLELLSVKDRGIDKIQISPEGRRDRIIEAIKAILLTSAEIRPLILAIEDLHWMDKNSEDVSKYLLDSIPGAKVFLIFTYRPEFVQTWGGKSFHSQITLNRLSNRESLSMVAHFLGTEDIDVALQELILEKTEGVPLFIEEFLTSLRELKLIVREDDRCYLAGRINEMAIPSTIQDVIMARVDSLPDGAKGVLQAGSVIEREFSHELIKEVTNLAEQELLSHLSILKEFELVYERGVYPKSSYVFRHALTREVVYGSMLTSKRKKLHEATGNAIERLHRDDIDQYYGFLTEHYIASDNYDKTSHYSLHAAKKSRQIGYMSDAIKYAEQAVASMEKLPKTNEGQKKMIDARTALGLYYSQQTCFADAKEAVNPIVDLALTHGYRKRLSQIYSIIGSYYLFVQGQFPEGFQYLENALRAAEDIGDAVSSAMANLWLGIGLCLNCDFERGASNFQKAIEINERANSLWGVSTVKSNLSFFLHCLSGRPTLAYETTAEAMRVAEQSGDLYSNARAYVSRGCAYYLIGQFEESREYLLNGVGLSDRIDFFAWESFGRQFLGDVLFELGQYESSIEQYDKAAYVMGQSRGLASWVSLNRLGMAVARVMNKEQAPDLESLKSLANENRFKLWEGWMRRYLGEILLNIGDRHTSEAQHWIEEAIEADERNGMRFHLARDYALYAELFKRKGDKFNAKEQLGKAIEIYRECGAGGWVTKAEEELEKLQ